MMFPLSISKEEVMERPLGHFEGKIIVLNSKDSIDAAIDELNECTVVGFDTEAKPTFKKGQRRRISLIQIATDKEVFLMRIKGIGITDKLRGFLENDQIKKIGIGLIDDFQLMNEIRPFEPRGFVDLNPTLTELGAQSIGARNLAAMILDLRISKSAQTSNWEVQELTTKQKNYAATDAWICLEIYKKLDYWGYI